MESDDVLDNPRLAPYRHLKRTNLTRWSGRFIAEGAKVVERLIASPFEVESVLVSERRRDFLANVPEGVATIVLPQDECERLTGFDFHGGGSPAASAGRRRRWKMSFLGTAA